MATKNQTQEQPEGTTAAELRDVGELRDRYRISWAVFAGVCSANGWRPGTTVSEEEFFAAVNKFNQSPMNAR